MKKNQTPVRSKTLFIVIACLLVSFVIGLYLFRGWVRMSVIPSSVQLVYGNSAQKVLETERTKLQDPLVLLGYESLERQGSECFTSLASAFSTTVLCSSEIRAYEQIDNSAEGKKTLNENAAKLQDLFRQNGWEGEYSDNSEYTSLKKLIASITSGIDYQPDATYRKNIDGVECFVHTHTAFSHPNPPAIGTQFTCDRVFDILGKASYQ